MFLLYLVFLSCVVIISRGDWSWVYLNRVNIKVVLTFSIKILIKYWQEGSCVVFKSNKRAPGERKTFYSRFRFQKVKCYYLIVTGGSGIIFPVVSCYNKTPDKLSRISFCCVIQKQVLPIFFYIKEINTQKIKAV